MILQEVDCYRAQSLTAIVRGHALSALFSNLVPKAASKADSAGC